LTLSVFLGFAAGSKFPFMQNMPPQQQQQSQNNWPMHMGFNQNSNEGGFPQHPNNQQHKPAGELDGKL
jgi:hypothetical protein